MDKNIKGDSMKNRTKLCIIAAWMLLLCTVCVFTSCGAIPKYFYVRNTQDEEITVSIYYAGDDSGSYTSVYKGLVASQTIPARTTVEFTVSEVGYYRVVSEVTSKPGVYTRKYAYWKGDDILVIF